MNFIEFSKQCQYSAKRDAGDWCMREATECVKDICPLYELANTGNGLVDTVVSKPMFPIQDAENIPIWLAEIVYEGYRNKFGNEQSLKRIGERGGFSKREVILFIKAY